MLVKSSDIVVIACIVCSNSLNPPELEQLLNQSGKKKPKRNPVHNCKPPGDTVEELFLTGDVADEELTQVLDDIYAKAGESCEYWLGVLGGVGR